MPVQHDETSNFIYKAAIYLGGVILGVLAKLAILKKDNDLNFSTGLVHGVIAMACAWLVWWILSFYGRLDLANISSVIVGRYADYILMIVWKSIKNLINSEGKQIKF